MGRTKALVCASAVACALGATAGTAQAGPPPPVNVVPPAITGIPLVGQELGYWRGIWTMGGSPWIYTQEWLRCNNTGGACVSTGVTTATYTVRSADVGHTIRVAVTNTGDNGNGSSTTANSPPTAPVLR